MKNRIVGMVWMMAALLVSCSSQEKEVLFNGQDLTGWTCFVDPKSEAAPEDVFMVKDGVIHITGMPFGYMRTTQKYTDYTLHVEWRWVGGKRTDSGIFNRLQDGDKIWPTGVQFQMKEEQLGLLIGGVKMEGAEGRNGFYRKNVTNEVNVEKAIGEWNITEIKCIGTLYQLIVNGVTINETKLEVTNGYIGLQSEGGPIEFRNIYIISSK